MGGSDVVQFYSSGPIVLTVRLRLAPPPELANNTQIVQEFLSNYPNGDYSRDLVLGYTDIQSQASVQQQINNNLSLSLTYFVLFFASIDIAIAFYDHSEDKNKQSEYDAEQAYEEGVKEAKRKYKSI
jgi:hypothetical protein